MSPRHLLPVIALACAACCTEIETRHAFALLPEDRGVACEVICEEERPDDHRFVECLLGRDGGGEPAAICTWRYDRCPRDLH